jgi:hypothetical protein
VRDVIVDAALRTLKEERDVLELNRGPVGQTVLTVAEMRRKSARSAQKNGMKSRTFLPTCANDPERFPSLSLPRDAPERTLRGPTRKPSRKPG